MQLLKTKYTSLLSLPLLLVLCVFALPSQKVFAASTYTVNSIGDDSDATPGDSTCETATPGECTLRAAIQEVNAGAGGDTINFGIAGSGVHTLTPASAYATITKAVVINGYSQTGSSANTAVSPNPFNGTLTIEIDGTSAGSSRGLRVGASNVTIKGLVINRFTRHGIDMQNQSNIIVQGNYIGTDPTGLIDRGNGIAGVNFNDGTGNVVGGSLPAERNIISGNTGAGFDYGGGANNVIIKGNYFGPDATGTAVLQNTGTGTGGNNVWLSEGDNCTVGGSSPGDSNVISGSPSSGLGLYMSSNCVVQGNYIGTNYQGNVQSGFGNIALGLILMGDSQNNLIGGVNSGEGNVIAGNALGIAVANIGGSLLSINNSILGNSIHDNAGGLISSLGIDLLGNTNDFVTFSDAGVTANDVGDPDVTSNVLMNFPVISSITSTNGTATITYDLDINDAEPGATGYRVEFFANDSDDPSGHGQGQTFIGSDTLAGDVTGQQVTLTLPDGVDGSKYITATATMTDASDDGFGHTSEFAENVEATLVAAVSDDNDGISSQVEDAAPNSGDANNDGTPDSEQDNVASFENPVSDEYAVLEVSDECSVTSVSIDEESTSHPDSNYSYPTGLMDFTLDCGTPGTTATVTQYYYGASGNFTVRKYNPNTKTYQTIDSASISNQTIGGQPAKVATYQVKDGSSLDLDGAEDGNIHDPAGLATSTGSLANTGQNTQNVVLLAALLLTSGLAVTTYNFNKQRKHNV